jgi:hypothetical protein
VCRVQKKVEKHWFRGKDRLLSCHLKVILGIIMGFSCSSIYNQAALTLVAGSSVVGLGSHRVKIELNEDLSK